MKKFFISLLLMCLFFFDGQAQQTYAVKGRVVDRESREPLSFASVSVWNSTQGVMTDSLGNYVIENLVSFILDGKLCGAGRRCDQ